MILYRTTHTHIFIAQQWPLLPCFSLCVVYWLFVDVISAFSFQANKYPQNTSTKKTTAPSETDRQHFTFCKWWGQRVYILWNIAASLPYGTRWKAFSLLHFIAAITNSLLQSVSTNPHRIYMELRGMREKKNVCLAACQQAKLLQERGRYSSERVSNVWELRTLKRLSV